MDIIDSKPTSPTRFSLRADDPNELYKLQLDYAWKWFAFHADQRTKMFNYMLVLFGLFATAIAMTLGKPDIGNATPWLCWGAALLAFIFRLIDKRNRNLIWLGEDVLIHLEREFLFGVGLKSLKVIGREKKEFDLGILNRQQEDEIKLRLEDGPAKWFHDARQGKHRFWMPAVAWLSISRIITSTSSPSCTTLVGWMFLLVQSMCAAFATAAGYLMYTPYVTQGATKAASTPVPAAAPATAPAPTAGPAPDAGPAPVPGAPGARKP